MSLPQTNSKSDALPYRSYKGGLLISNLEDRTTRLGKSLLCVNEILRPFLEFLFRRVHGEEWWNAILQAAKKTSPTRPNMNELDTRALIGVMIGSWDNIVKHSTFNTQSDRNLMFELNNVRNKWAHQYEYTIMETIRDLDTIELFLKSLGRDMGELAKVLTAKVQEEKEDLILIHANDIQIKRQNILANFVPNSNPNSHINNNNNSIHFHKEIDMEE